MKKPIVFFIYSLFLISAKAQITKGNWMVGGSASFLTSKIVGTAPNTASGNQNSLNINPGIGYFFINKFAGGIRVLINYENVGVGSSRISSTQYSLGPFARYYFLPKEKQVNIFSEVDYSYTVPAPHSQNQNSDGYIIELGTAVYFNTSVGLEFTLQYANSKSNIGISKTFQIGLGFQIHLEKVDK